jgi:hypothetical protein
MNAQDINELRDVARRVVWFKEPDDALEDREHFIAHVLAHGALSDVQKTRRFYGDTAIGEALKNAPSGIFSARQWAFWCARYGLDGASIRSKRSFSSAR